MGHSTFIPPPPPRVSAPPPRLFAPAPSPPKTGPPPWPLAGLADRGWAWGGAGVDRVSSCRCSLGFLPGSGAQDLGSQIQFLRFVDDASKLLRWKLSAALVATTPLNKVVAVCCLVARGWRWTGLGGVDLGAAGVCLLRRVCAAPGRVGFRRLPLLISFRPTVAAWGWRG
jgi:hypothetical protein